MAGPQEAGCTSCCSVLSLLRPATTKPAAPRNGQQIPSVGWFERLVLRCPWLASTVGHASPCEALLTHPCRCQPRSPNPFDVPRGSLWLRRATVRLSRDGAPLGWSTERMLIYLSGLYMSEISRRHAGKTADFCWGGWAGYKVVGRQQARSNRHVIGIRINALQHCLLPGPCTT